MLKVVAYTGKPPDAIFVNVALPHEYRLNYRNAVSAAKIAFGHRQHVSVFDGEAVFYTSNNDVRKIKEYKNDRKL